MGNTTSSKQSKSPSAYPESFNLVDDCKQETSNNCKSILSESLNQGLQPTCALISAIRTESFVACKKIDSTTERKQYANDFTHDTVLDSVDNGDFAKCVRRKGADRACAHTLANYQKEYPHKLDTLLAIKSSLVDDEVPPTTSIHTKDDMYSYQLQEHQFYPPQMPTGPGNPEIHHAMTIIGYGTAADKDNKEFLILQNQWSNDHTANVVKVRVDDHPEVIDFAFKPFTDKSKGITNPITLRFTDDSKAGKREEMSYIYRPALGGDTIAGNGVIESIVCGGDTIADLQHRQYQK